jgi:hypothetical protein
MASRIKNASDNASRASARAQQAAKKARIAAAAAGHANQLVCRELIKNVKVPKYIPDRTFVDVILHVLMSEAGSAEVGDSPDPERGSTHASFWRRYESALGVVRGMTSRLPDGEAKTRIVQTLAELGQTLNRVKGGVYQTIDLAAELESKLGRLREAAAAIPDDHFRTAVEKEIDASLAPLHAIGQDVLILERIEKSIACMADSSIKTALTTFINQAGEDFDQFKKSIAAWYNDVMDHASGWYKRNTQVLLLAIGAVLCVLNNVDTVKLVRALSGSPELRAKVALAAENLSEAGLDTVKSDSAAELKQALFSTRLPLWWSRAEFQNWWGVDAPEALSGHPAGTSRALHFIMKVLALIVSTKVLGLVISTMAVSMGAPFWFDVLNKFVNVRLIGKRPEPSVPIASEPTKAAAAANPA